MRGERDGKMLLNAIIIGVLLLCVYGFVAKKYYTNFVDIQTKDGHTSIKMKNPFQSINSTVNTYNDKVAVEEKSRSEALGAIGQ